MIDSLVCMIVREKRPEERPGGFKLTQSNTDTVLNT